MPNIFKNTRNKLAVPHADATPRLKMNSLLDIFRKAVSSPYPLILGGAVLVIILICLFYILMLPKTVLSENVLLSYSQKGTFNYLLYLRPSYLYSPNYQEPAPNPQYPLSAVGTIDFTYSFNPSNKGSSSAAIDAVMENPGIWQKKINLIPQTSNTGNFTLRFSLDTQQISSIFDGIEKETNLSSAPRNLTLIATVITGEQQIVQSLPLKLDNNIIEISNALDQVQPSGTGKFDYVVNPVQKPIAQPDLKFPVKIVSTLDFVFSFISTNNPASSMKIEAVIENHGIWQKTITVVLEATAPGNFTVPFSLNIDELLKLFDDIDKETGINSMTRSITINAYVNTGPDVFTQSLPLVIDGDVLSVGGNLQQVQSGSTGTFDYAVSLKPNSIYDSKVIKPTPAAAGTPALKFDLTDKPSPATDNGQTITIGPGKTTFVKLVDKMDITFHYEFNSSKPVNSINSDIEIDAIVEAPGVWSKQFVLLNTTKTGNFDISFPLDVAGYESLIEAIRNETGVSAESYNITVTAMVHNTDDTAVGKITETFSPSLKGTIKNNVLDWDKELASNKAGAIKQPVSIPNKFLGITVSKVSSIFIVLSVILLMVCLGLFVLYTRYRPMRKLTIEKEALKIKRKYGGRMAEAMNYAPVEGEKMVYLNSIDDLITVADDLGKPVIHLASDISQEPQIYYVIDGITRYQYLLITDNKETAGQAKVPEQQTTAEK